MGTRAVVKFKGKPILATHWDGYPRELGKDLASLKNKSVENIIRVASERNIDQIDPKFAPDKPVVLKTKVYQHDKGKYVDGEKVTYFPKSDEEAQKYYKKIDVFGGTATTKGKKEYKVSSVYPMSKYGDWAEWEYDIRDDGVYARPLEGSYDEADKSGKFTLITPKMVGKYEDKVEEMQTKEYMEQELNFTKKDPEHGVKEIMRTLASGYSQREGDYPQITSYKNKLSKDDKEWIENYLKVPKVRQMIGKGWHGENLAHRLARMGIKVKGIKNDVSKLNKINKRLK